MEVTLRDEEKKVTLVYEVGGFESAKWLPLSKPTNNPPAHKK